MSDIKLHRLDLTNRCNAWISCLRLRCRHVSQTSWLPIKSSSANRSISHGIHDWMSSETYVLSANSPKYNCISCRHWRARHNLILTIWSHRTNPFWFSSLERFASANQRHRNLDISPHLLVEHPTQSTYHSAKAVSAPEPVLCMNIQKTLILD